LEGGEDDIALLDCRQTWSFEAVEFFP